MALFRIHRHKRIEQWSLNMKSLVFAAIVGFLSLTGIGVLHSASRTHGGDEVCSYGLGAFGFGGYGGPDGGPCGNRRPASVRDRQEETCRDGRRAARPLSLRTDDSPKDCRRLVSGVGNL